MDKAHKQPTVGFGITTWRSPDTLANTLESYAEGGLAEFFDQCFVHALDASPRDLEIASHFGIEIIKGENQGIAESMRSIAQHLDTDIVLFLENDCPVVEPKEVIQKRLEVARNAFAQGEVDMFRLRHRWQFGEMFALHKYLSLYGVKDLHPDFHEPALIERHPQKNLLYKIRKYQNLQSMKGRAVYVENHPEQVFPDVFKRKVAEGEEWFITDSRYLNWTNQSCMARRDLFLEELMPYVDAHPSKRLSNGFRCPERHLNNSWWRGKKYQIGVGTGLFTHRRFDGSWRAGHHAYEG